MYLGRKTDAVSLTAERWLLKPTVPLKASPKKCSRSRGVQMRDIVQMMSVMF